MRLLQTISRSISRTMNYFHTQRVEVNDVELLVPPEEGGAVNQPAMPVSADAATTGKMIKYLGGIYFAKENLPRLGLAAMLTACNTGLNFLSPYLFSETINLLSSEEESVDIGGVSFDRTMLISALVASYSLSQIIPNLREQVLIPVSYNNTKKIVTNNTNHLLKKSLNYHVNTPFPDQLYFMQKGFAVASTATPLMKEVAPMMIEIVIACSVLSTRYGAEMGLGLFGLLSTYTIYSGATAKPIVNLREKSLAAGNAAFQNFTTALAQYKNMRDFNKYDETMRNVVAAINEMVKADILAAIRPQQIGLGHIAISRFAMLAAALWVGLGVRAEKYTSDEFIIIIGYLNQLAVYLPSFGSAVNQLFASYPDVKFVVGEVLKPDEVVDAHPGVPLIIAEDEAASLAFEGVSFSYPVKAGEAPKPPMANALSFVIAPGQRVALVSESGAGKTTLFNLLYRYYQPESGVIKINGQDIGGVSLDALQKHIGLIGQTPNLFKGSIRENICYGAPVGSAPTDNDILKLAESVNLASFLTSFPDGLNTDVGEGGKKLSGGQQQKVAILRGLMKPCKIRLLDEVTAPFDSQSARSVLHGLFSAEDQPTTLMITHKLTEVQLADAIMVLEGGRCIAMGRHHELLADCELYQRLWHDYMNTQDDECTRAPSMRQ
jgi:ABC-type multidrug transport system fused ATPase/permease subunit